MDIAVGTLRLRCRTAERARSVNALEDALRTAITDDRRLWLVRRMKVGAAGSSGKHGDREGAVRSAWTAAVGDACHGSGDGAAAANTVWFASKSEARAVLLRRLLAGRAVDAWFWKLAVPEWRGQGLRGWLVERISAALAGDGEREALQISEICVEAGATGLLISVLAEATPRLPDAVRQAVSFEVPCSLDGPVHAHEGLSAASDGHATDQLAMTLPPRLRALMIAIIRIGGTQRIAATLIRQVALSASPALALAPGVLEAVVRATLVCLSGQGGAPGGAQAAPASGRTPAARAIEATEVDAEPMQAPSAISASPLPPALLQAPMPSPAVPAARTAEAGAPPAEVSTVDVPHGVPLLSQHAGLWLLIPGIADLGFAAWLQTRPDLLPHHPGRQLLWTIARHYRIADAALLLSALGEADAIAADAIDPDWAVLWCRALDGWYRRTARRRLHDLVHRPGRLLCLGDRIDVHFPASAADIALRRCALDRDPGWTAWLGQSVRYHFDGPETLL